MRAPEEIVSYALRTLDADRSQTLCVIG